MIFSQYLINSSFFFLISFCKHKKVKVSLLFYLFDYFTVYFITMSKELSSKKGGRPFLKVWDGHMIKGVKSFRGHYSATCSYCNFSWKNGNQRLYVNILQITARNAHEKFHYILQKLLVKKWETNGGRR